MAPSESAGPPPVGPVPDWGTLRSMLGRYGVNRAVLYGVLAKVFAGLFGLATILLIAWRLPREIQGYYYTFLNLIALQVFAEMGLGIVVTQFASHYWAALRLDDRGRIDGEPQALSNLVSLGRLSLRWYGIAGVAAGAVLTLSGMVFFSRTPSQGVAWQWPWVTLCVLSGLKLWLVPIWSLLEGCNQVASLYLFRFLSTLSAGILTSLAILVDWGLWALSAGLAAELAVGVVFLFANHLPFVLTFFKGCGGPGVEWRKDILPLQIRIAVTWMAGFFVSSFVTPVLFYFHGPSLAGQWGMTWSMFSMVTSISLVWVVTRAPQFGVWVAQREFSVLDQQFWRVTRISFSLAVLGTLLLWTPLWLLHHWSHPLGVRMLSPLPAALLGISVILMIIPHAQSVYLRAHKQEPYMISSLVQSFLVGLTTVILGRRFGALGVAAGYLGVAVLVALPWTMMIWIRRRAEWHAPTGSLSLAETPDKIAPR